MLLGRAGKAVGGLVVVLMGGLDAGRVVVVVVGGTGGCGVRVGAGFVLVERAVFAVTVMMVVGELGVVVGKDGWFVGEAFDWDGGARGNAHNKGKRGRGEIRVSGEGMYR